MVELATSLEPGPTNPFNMRCKWACNVWFKTAIKQL